ncbi:SCP2 sterol-binding domain-containing protein [Pollutimonas sp. H1-120]|uniref:ubiquinone biosynthesis accessory factor UbiJ n=1 Tax=Pollutimonas sp. H1-120 TaxID=3148824 RepID=UPI003B51FE43
MFSLPPFFAPSAVHARVLNKLLLREDWARDRLSRHSGKTVRFAIGRFKTGFAIQASGLVQACDPAVVPDVTLTIPSDKLPGLPAVLRSRDPDAVAEIMHIEGDAGLARVVSDLARDLRWDIEEDLAKLVGDMAALRLLQAGKAVMQGVQLTAGRLAGNVGEFLSEESGMMANRPGFEDWTAGLLVLRQRLDGLEARVAALGTRGSLSKG